MKLVPSTSTKFILLAATLLVAVASNNAMADGGRHGGHGHWGGGHWHSGISLNIGAPFYWPYYAYAPVYYPQPVYVAPAPQVVYVEQAQAPIAPPPVQQYWYYCANPQGYYPNVQQCPAGWQKVLPQPAR